MEDLLVFYHPEVRLVQEFKRKKQAILGDGSYFSSWSPRNERHLRNEKHKVRNFWVIAVRCILYRPEVYIIREFNRGNQLVLGDQSDFYLLSPRMFLSRRKSLNFQHSNLHKHYIHNTSLQNNYILVNAADAEMAKRAEKQK